MGLVVVEVPDSLFWSSSIDLFEEVEGGEAVEGGEEQQRFRVGVSWSREVLLEEIEVYKKEACVEGE